MLGVSEKEVIKLAESGQIPAYKIGGVYLRFKREQVEAFRRSSPQFAKKLGQYENYSFRERVTDFFYYNDFYILTSLIIILLIFIISRGS